MKSNKNWKLTLSGHTDNMGAAAFNLDLSKRRAEAVKTFLVQNGVPASQILLIIMVLQNLLFQILPFKID